VTCTRASSSVLRDDEHATVLSRRRRDAVVTTAERNGRLGPLRRWARQRPADVVDLFVYVVVLNLFVEYFPAVISESFTLSLLTAALLKVTLELVLRVKSKVVRRVRTATTGPGKAFAGLLLWVVAVVSKIVVLELVNLVFGDSVSLGGFVSVTLLVVTLLLSRAGVRRLLYGVRMAD
jgi:hypothetical protein